MQRQDPQVGPSASSGGSPIVVSSDDGGDVDAGPHSATASGQPTASGRERKKLYLQAVREVLKGMREKLEKEQKQKAEHLCGEAILTALGDSLWDRAVELIDEDICGAPQLLYKDVGGMTALHKAARAGKDKIAEMILNKCPEAANIPTYVSEGHN